jgi:hypothetical protein
VVPACHVEGALPFPLACLGDSEGESGALAAEGAIYLLPGLKAGCWIAFLRPREVPNSGAPIDQSAAARATSCGFWVFPRNCFTFDEGLEGGGAMGCRGDAADAANAANAVNAAKRPMQQMLENSLF